MLLLIGFLHAAPMTPPDPDLSAKVYDALRYDLWRNALIGNGSDLAWAWSNAKPLPGAPKAASRIRDLACRQHGSGFDCVFGLFREGGASRAFGDVPSPDRLLCKARLRRDPEDHDALLVVHEPPPPDGGHSITTLQCKLP